MKVPWLLVAGDLTPLGGMDHANYALARYLAVRGDDVHLVTHRVWPDLEALPSVTVHRVWRPCSRHLLGGPLLSRAGRHSWRAMRVHGARAVVNGGNCAVPATNWVHYLHAAFRPQVVGSPVHRVKVAYAYERELRAERAALSDARVVICNSHRTRRDVIEYAGIDESRVHVVYYGTDPAVFAPVDETARSSAKRGLGLCDARPLVGFVGALGDRRKGFDTLFEVWKSLCRRRAWDAHLVVVGHGAELPAWRTRARAAGIADRMSFLGFREDVPDILAALDALVHPARYEAYGLSVQEALCRGVPALVSRSAGVAERYRPELQELLIDSPDDPGELEARLILWRRNLEQFRRLVMPLSNALRAHSWDSMARQIADCVQRVA